MSSQRTCPNVIDLARMFSERSDETLWAHVQSCPECAAQWQDLTRLRELARQLPTEAPSFERREQVRTELLSRAVRVRRMRVRRRRSRWRIAAAVGLSVTALITAAALRTPAPSGHVYRAVAHGSPHSRFVRVTSQPDEIVRLAEGTLALSVAPLRKGERFRVVVGDGEVEVRGTAFDVVAHADRLVEVRVHHGKVEVRPQRGPAVVLTTGQHWQPPTHVPLPLPLPLPIPASPEVARDPPPPASLRIAHPLTKRRVVAPGPSMSKAEAAFERAWPLLRAGHAAQAATAFEEVLALNPDNGLEETAAFWHGVALARAGRGSDAAQALYGFLARHADSPRAGEASAMLGWMLLKAHDVAGARQRFTAALHDPVPEVRASARAGVEAADAAGGSGSRKPPALRAPAVLE